MYPKTRMTVSRLVVLGVFLVPMRLVADQPFDKQVRALIQNAQVSVRTIEINETVRVERVQSDQDVARIRKQYLGTMEKAREEALDDLGDDPAQSDIDWVNNYYNQRAAEVDQHVEAYRANASLHFERVTFIDLATSRARIEITDLRDLPKTPRPENEFEMVFPVSKSGVFVELPTETLRRSEFTPGAVTKSLTGRFNPAERWLAIGGVPAWVVEEDRRVVLTEADTKMRKLSVIDPGTPRRRETPSKGAAVHCICLPEKDNRLQQWVTYTADGDRFRTIDYADYRQVNGIWFPFEVTERLDVNGVEGYRVEKRTVSEVRVNLPIAEERFQLEAIEEGSSKE